MDATILNQPNGDGKCLLCEAPARPFSDPPFCARHLDMAVLVEFMRGQGEEITPEAVKGRLEKALTRSDVWVITPDDVEVLLPDFLEVAR